MFGILSAEHIPVCAMMDLFPEITTIMIAIKNQMTMRMLFGQIFQRKMS